MPEKAFLIRYLSANPTAPWKLLEMVFQSVFKFIRTFSRLFIFFSKHPMKALVIHTDKGPLVIWKFTMLEVPNLDSAVFPSFLKQHSQTVGRNLRLHNWASWCHRSGMQLLTPLRMSFLEALPHLPISFPWENWFLLWGCTATFLGPFSKTQVFTWSLGLGAVCFEEALQIQGGVCISEAGGPVFWNLMPWSVCRRFPHWLVLSSPWIPRPDALPGSILAFLFFLCDMFEGDKTMSDWPLTRDNSAIN